MLSYTKPCQNLCFMFLEAGESDKADKTDLGEGKMFLSCPKNDFLCSLSQILCQCFSFCELIH